MIITQGVHATYPPDYGHTVVQDSPPQDAVVDPTLERLFALSNAASDKAASPIDMQSIVFAVLSRLDEESASSDSHTTGPTTTVTSNNGPDDATEAIADLLSKARAGDSDAWEKIVHRYSSLVFATVRSFRLQDADMLDAVQMTWLRLAENAHRVPHPERLAGWLATTARRECLHILRQQAKDTPAQVDTMTENVIDPYAGPEQRVVARDTARTLWCLVAQLSPVRRTLLRALFTDNPRPYTEVARIAGIPPALVGPTRARALKQLRRRLDEHELTP